jgi:hypothetical protein
MGVMAIALIMVMADSVTPITGAIMVATGAGIMDIMAVAAGEAADGVERASTADLAAVASSQRDKQRSVHV